MEVVNNMSKLYYFLGLGRLIFNLFDMKECCEDLMKLCVCEFIIIM